MLAASGTLVPLTQPVTVDEHGVARGGLGVPLGYAHLAEVQSRAQLATIDEPSRLTPRIGYDSDVSRGGTTAYDPGGDYPTGDRLTFMRECWGAYLATPWLSAPIDVIARTVTAGGVVVEPDGDDIDAEHDDIDNAPLEVQKLARLIQWVNPNEDMVQLMRGVVADLDIYGDSFTEIVWALGEPVAMYSLDAATMSVQADEHGIIDGYWQRTESHPEPVWFDPHEIIHVSADSPRGSLYGVGTVQKAFWSATTYLFAAGLLKERMRKGDPPDIHVDAPLEQDDLMYRRWTQQYRNKNIGANNLGNPITTKGGYKIQEMRTSARADLVAIMTAQRDIMLSVAGVPPAQVGVIESGNLGGGTGTSQWKTFQLNTVFPKAALVMEKFNFALLRAFGITGWKLAFATVDYRDDMVLENIRVGRVRTGIWSLNEARRDIAEPPVDGGDDHIMVERSWAMDWRHMPDFARSQIVKNGGVNYPPLTDDGFPPPSPYATPAAVIGPRQTPPGVTFTDPDGDPDAAMHDPVSTDTQDPGDVAAKPAPARTDQEPAAESWMGEIAAHYRGLLVAAQDAHGREP